MMENMHFGIMMQSRAMMMDRTQVIYSDLILSTSIRRKDKHGSVFSSLIHMASQALLKAKQLLINS